MGVFYSMKNSDLSFLRKLPATNGIAFSRILAKVDDQAMYTDISGNYREIPFHLTFTP